jgi:hypothetical protein
MKNLEGKTRDGDDMSSWRIVWLQGDEEFLEPLYNFTSNHRFILGSSAVVIRGGERRNMTAQEKEQEKYNGSACCYHGRQANGTRRKGGHRTPCNRMRWARG